MTQRTTARRAFIRELSVSTYTFQEREDDKAPVYLLLPTGEKINRVFIVGTITEISIDSDNDWVAGRLSDPTGTIRFEAGQYQPEYVKAAFHTFSTPELVAVTGKVRTYRPENGRIETKIRISEVSTAESSEQDRWILNTATRTLDRLQKQPTQSKYSSIAQDVYSYDLETFRDAALEALTQIENTSGATH